jgi:hypothetical protein
MKSRTMNSDHKIARDTSIAVRRWLEKQPAVKEESITDWLLYTISEAMPRVTYKSFTRNEEARTSGADWEWWFVYPRYSFKMRVQAKKLFPKKDNYPGIAHTNQYGLQIDRLLADATQKNYAPFYAFYSAESGNVLCGNGINDEGVYFAGARNVYKTFLGGGKRQIQTPDALALSIALSCFFGCPMIIERSPEGPIAFFQHYYADEIRRDANLPVDQLSEQNLLGFHSKIPNYLSSLLESKQNIPDWWETEFSYDLQGTNSILVYDGRNQ